MNLKTGIIALMLSTILGCESSLIDLCDYEGYQVLNLSIDKKTRCSCGTEYYIHLRNMHKFTTVKVSASMHKFYEQKLLEAEKSGEVFVITCTKKVDV